MIGKDASSGVIDSKQQAFGYHKLLGFDDSAVPANPGVNPSPTITAMTERAMTFIPKIFSPNDASAYQALSHALKNVRYSTVTLFAGHWGPIGGIMQHWIGRYWISEKSSGPRYHSPPAIDSGKKHFAGDKCGGNTLIFTKVERALDIAGCLREES